MLSYRWNKQELKEKKRILQNLLLLFLYNKSATFNHKSASLRKYSFLRMICCNVLFSPIKCLSSFRSTEAMNPLILMLLIVTSSTALTSCRYNQDCANKKFCWYGYCWPNNLGVSCSTSDHCSSGLTCSRPTGSKNGLCVISSAVILLPTKIIIKNVTFQIGNPERNSSSNAQTTINIPTITTDTGLEDILTNKHETNIVNKTTTEFLPNFTVETTVLEEINTTIPSFFTTETNSLSRTMTEFSLFSSAKTDIPSRITTTNDTTENTAEDIAMTKDTSFSTIEDIIEDTLMTKDITEDMLTTNALSTSENITEDMLTTNDASSSLSENIIEETLVTNDTSSTTENIEERLVTNESSPYTTENIIEETNDALSSTSENIIKEILVTNDASSTTENIEERLVTNESSPYTTKNIIEDTNDALPSTSENIIKEVLVTNDTSSTTENISEGRLVTNESSSFTTENTTENKTTDEFFFFVILAENTNGNETKKDILIFSYNFNIINIKYNWWCDKPWKFFRGRCYFQMDDGSYTYYEAKKNCIDMGAVLVTIVNRDVTEFLYSNFYFKHPFWIGLLYKDKGWKWPDGTKLRYQLWGENEPNTMYQCVFAETEKNGRHWYTAECNDKILHGDVVGYVCQQ
ncbi:Perlucin-like protein [Dirofilaria immitis]